MANRRGLLSLAVSLFIGCYFLAYTKDARFSYFTPDDCLNLYRAWANPLGGLLKAGVLFFLNDWQHAFRPVPSLWYRLIYDLAGFNPLPFHFANLLILGVNIWLTYCLSRRLTGSREIGVLAALLISYHGRFAPLYFDTAFIFDGICYFFYFAALLLYVRIRSQQRQLKWPELLILGGLYICALNSKEMALTLPATLAVYEWLYHRPSAGSWRELPRWLVTYGRGFVLALVLMLVCVIGRQFTSALAASSEFQPVFSWERFMATSRSFMTELLFQSRPVSSGMVLLIWLILFTMAWASKSAPLKFAWLFIMLSVIPVAFIPPRGPAQYYIPLFGWALYLATAIVRGSMYVVGARWPAPARFARPAVVFFGVLLFMTRINTHTSWSDVPSVVLEGERFRSIVAEVHRLVPQPRPGSRMLFLSDPLDDRWQLTSLMRLSYRDRDLGIDQVKFMPSRPSDAEIKRYDYVFSYAQCRFFDSVEPPQGGPHPGIVFDEWCRPSAFHMDGRVVTPQRPAKRGEALMSMMSDLGETQPPAPDGQAFPANPLAQVTSPVQVLVDGQPAEIWVKIGWPGLVNRYRLDFRMQKSVGSGMRVVEVTSLDATGPGVPIAVK